MLVDLKGYTGDNRIEIMALKPAPIIVSLLGFCGSTGSDFHDHIIADKNVIPERHKKYFTENIIYMPDIYWPTDNSANIADMILIFESVKNPKNPRVLKKIIKIGIIAETGYLNVVIADVINPNISAAAKRVKLTNKTTEMSS